MRSRISISTNNTQSAEAGFALIELLTAVAISSVILLLAYQAQSRIIGGITLMTRESEKVNRFAQNSRRLENDFASCYAADFTLYPLVSVRDARPGDALLSFTMLAHSRVYPVSGAGTADHASDLKTVTYHIIESPEGKKDLVRRSREFTDADTLYRSETVLFSDITEAGFEFFIDGKWNDRFDAERKMFPGGIRLTVSVREGERTEKLVISGILGMRRL
jgi:prepilin-type N-terminal cleavage/methylation domain-containing protein